MNRLFKIPTVSTQTKKILLFLLSALAIFSLGFYWLQWRPSEARKLCMQQVRNKIKNNHVDLSSQLINTWFRVCLVDRGMKPESLIVND